MKKQEQQAIQLIIKNLAHVMDALGEHDLQDELHGLDNQLCELIEPDTEAQVSVLSEKYDIRLYLCKGETAQLHYGLDVQKCHYYSDIAHAIGYAFAHALACDSKLQGYEVEDA